ncbi:MAG TPA: (2Fe-2S)-binding protein [Acidimicrobiales bacterium]|nr:(2Fe-2S)-binding protein [Acidimicrobiales bacterium]
MTAHEVEITVNGASLVIEVASDETLLRTLRERLHLTGTKEGCGTGACGACTVLLDGDMAPSCIALTMQHVGKDITTVEGLANDEKLSELQAAFIETGGFQCGACTSGQLMAATALLRHTLTPSRDLIEDWMAGNLCRCTGYVGIVAAIALAAERVRVRSAALGCRNP